MKFRPCIDIHNGKVKQLVGGSLKDEGNVAKENFVSEKRSSYYADLYKEKGLKGGHIIILNSKDSEYFEATRDEAVNALETAPGLMQIGGGINNENAKFFIDRGASHVIVTSFIFEDGKISYEKLDKLVEAVTKEKIVIDLSCRNKDGKYFVVTDRWQTFTDVEVNVETLSKLSSYCDEFLIHGVDVEGKQGGMEEDLVKVLAEYVKESDSYVNRSGDGLSKITYAGGLGSFENIEKFGEISNGYLDFTIGSALDIFGGKLEFEKVIKAQNDIG